MPLLSDGAEFNDNLSFMNKIFGKDILERVIDYITANYRPDELYGKEDLEDWARNQGFHRNY